ncbi:CPBP family intramembrane glutamic endopeptidase [Limosilactobacillus urinaemulieris]|uniref:CPBP family intramembrane glutamic endopeptidase n=1 Tax=Limosilactobacillus urinaemulieris TaxID=2742600 RepID=UPI0028F00DA7|nr:CPBP family intramembrane glutamic endopeptidase [Limosilactobacillus urinaemulieris]
MKLLKNSLTTYRLQLLLAIIIVSINTSSRGGVASLLVLLMLIIALLFTSVARSSRNLRYINWEIQLLTAPVLLSFTTGSLLMLTRSLSFVSILVLLSYLVIFIPYTKLYVKPLRNTWLRLLWVIFFFQIAIGPASYYGVTVTTGNVWFTSLITTGCLGAIVYLIVIIKAFASWHLQTPLSFAKYHVKVNWGVILVYLLLVLLFLYSNLTGYQELRMKGGLQLWQDFLTSLESGIGEETLCRFAILTLLMIICRHSKWKVPLVIFTSSLIFGLLHFINLIDQSWSLTVYQFCFTTVSGIFFALIFLYTGRLWLVMVIHFVMDFVSSFSEISAMNSTISLADYQSIVVLALLMLVLTIWMMRGKRGKVMQTRAQLLITKN